MARSSRVAILAACVLCLAGSNIALLWRLGLARETLRQLQSSAELPPSHPSHGDNGQDPALAALQNESAELAGRLARARRKLDILLAPPPPPDPEETKYVVWNRPHEVLDAHPDWQPYRRHKAGLLVHWRYSHYFQQSALTAEKRVLLKELLVDESQIAHDIGEILEGTGTPEIVRTARARVKLELESEIRDLLGEAEYERLQQERALGPIRDEVSRLFTPALDLTGQPLRPAQAARLTELMLQYRGPRTEVSRARAALLSTDYDQTRALTEADRRLLAALEREFTPQQVKAMEQVLSAGNRIDYLTLRFGFNNVPTE